MRVSVSDRILRFADNPDPLEIRNVNGCGNFNYNIDRPSISRATPNKHSGQPEILFGGTCNELAHDCNVLSGNEVPQRLYGFGAQKIGDFHGNVIISFLVKDDPILRIGRESGVRSEPAEKS
jgi:hypothetical protein